MMKIIVNCGPAELYIGRCIASIRSQTHRDWEAFVSIDPCGDRTLDNARTARGGDLRIHIHANLTQQFSMVNLIEAVRRSGNDPEDVLVVLDGDDWFATENALKLIENTYLRFDCWMTYGSWVSDHPNMPGRWPAYPDGTVDFRRHEWLGTAVRTWKRWLWERIDDSAFRDAEGNYFRVTEDRAAMLPMLEMSGTEKARHIEDVLMFYNRTSPYACASVRREEMLANAEYLSGRPSYSRLAAKPDGLPAAESVDLQAILS